MATQATLNPFLLAANTPDPDPRLLPLLQSSPALASQQDGHGYSLLHAATSYNHVALLRSLVQDLHVDVNLKDEDGETCLFVAETLEVARCLVEELHIDTTVQNDESMTAAEKIEAEDEYPDIAAYLRQLSQRQEDGNIGIDQTVTNAASTNETARPPPLPANMKIDINNIPEDQLGLDDLSPDPEFRRRIEELAAKENLNTEEGQQELRELITDAVRGVGDQDRGVRRRTD